MKILRLLAAAGIVLAVAAGAQARSVRISDASAPLRGDATVGVAYSASDGLAVGAEVRVDLPDGINYVAGSATATSQRRRPADIGGASGAAVGDIII